MQQSRPLRYRGTTLYNLRYSVLLKLIRKSNAFTHIRLSLVMKFPSKASTNLAASQTSTLSSS